VVFYLNLAPFHLSSNDNLSFFSFQPSHVSYGRVETKKDVV
jgi:hypothetical protein